MPPFCCVENGLVPVIVDETAGWGCMDEFIDDCMKFVDPGVPMDVLIEKGLVEDDERLLFIGRDDDVVLENEVMPVIDEERGLFCWLIVLFEKGFVPVCMGNNGWLDRDDPVWIEENGLEGREDKVLLENGLVPVPVPNVFPFEPRLLKDCCCEKAGIEGCIVGPELLANGL